ncbi:uncharacterized protein LOC134669534 [Cydia fagiglandana]|uniref:uncharacterized protein LOC134669534 n=1 Tax=Cydia fagiglandana TaxID=1458189 RepID=UPI002FEE287A
MSHFGDFMDGVPVKISEKYKRPPRIDLPHSVHECPLRAQNVVDNAVYCTQFETNVLSKLKELRSAKETKKNERKHRLQLLEEAKQKKLDAIAAAEAEEKLKQLSVSEVSYPSTDEISAISPDEKTDKNCDTTVLEESPEPEPPVPEVTYQTCSNPEPELNILQPIQLQANYPQNSLLDDPDPLQEYKTNNKIKKIPHYNHNVETLTFRDFENDTSSPFDNVELKTINDMELLAQILQSQKESTTSCNPQQFISEQTFAAPSCASQAQTEGLGYLPNSYNEQQMQGPGLMYITPHHYPVSNGYYVPADNVCDNQMPMENMYMPNYQYYVPTNPYPANPQYYDNSLPVNTDINQPQSESTFIPQPYYFHQYQPMPAQIPTESLVQDENKTNENTSTQIKSRSRSVPDIVRELNEEIMLARLRANERSSHNVSPAPTNIPQPSSSTAKKERKSKRKSEQLPNPLEKLSPKLQDMCRKIHGMGFPLDRVARVCTLVGDNDKKVIEGLLILGELMDLGFSEGRVSAALAKHEFNRDKALDDLVS